MGGVLGVTWILLSPGYQCHPYHRPCCCQLHHPFAQEPEFPPHICSTRLTCTRILSTSRSISGDWATTSSPKCSFFFPPCPSRMPSWDLIFPLIVDLLWCSHLSLGGDLKGSWGEVQSFARHLESFSSCLCLPCIALCHLYRAKLLVDPIFSDLRGLLPALPAAGDADVPFPRESPRSGVAWTCLTALCSSPSSPGSSNCETTSLKMRS